MTGPADRTARAGAAPTWLRRESGIVARVTAVHAEVAALAGTEIAVPAVSAENPWRAGDAVSALTRYCAERLRSSAENDVLGIRALCALLVELHRLAIDVNVESLRGRTERMTECSAGLARLRTISNTRDLLDGVCEEVVRRCGFGRAVLSRVEGTTWSPWLAYSVDGDELSSWFPGWVGQGIPLDGRIPESRLLSEPRPTIVYDTESVPVHRPIIVDSGRSSSYVVTPIVQSDVVVGFIHADHRPSQRRIDDVDRDVLWAFTVGFGYVYERTMLLDRLRDQGDEARAILSSAADRISELGELGGERMRARNRSLDPEGGGRRIEGAYGELTARETEVFRLMAEGATNSAIAKTLIVTEDTVKSHVKHILRKLGVANRSQAVAWSLRDDA